MSEKYFVASNSCDGFCSYYDNAFDIQRLSKIYAIKGGSGTGKAFFMRAIASRAEQKGFGVRYIYCSSDSSSLDGIIIDGLKIAVLDGTAPHIYEPKLVGAVDAIVDLGVFLDGRLLAKSRERIEEISNEKKKRFEKAYRYLKAYSLFSKSIEDIVLPCIKFEKIKKYANTLKKGISAGNGEVENRLIRAIGMRGLSSFDTYYENSKIYYEIKDYYDSAHVLLSCLYISFADKKADIYISNNPIMKERLDAIFVKREGLCFEISNQGNKGARGINMKRFFDIDAMSKMKREYRSIARLRDEALSLALSELAEVKKHHFVLEEIYGSAMDFEAKEKFTERFCNKLL